MVITLRNISRYVYMYIYTVLSTKRRILLRSTNRISIIGGDKVFISKLRVYFRTAVVVVVVVQGVCKRCNPRREAKTRAALRGRERGRRARGEGNRREKKEEEEGTRPRLSRSWERRCEDGQGSSASQHHRVSDLVDWAR